MCLSQVLGLRIDSIGIYHLPVLSSGKLYETLFFGVMQHYQFTVRYFHEHVLFGAS